MKYTLGHLDREIEQKIEAYGAESGIEKEELISEILSEHSEIEGDDIEFALVCTLTTVTTRVERKFREIKKKESPEDDDAQGTLPGYAYIRQRYIVEDEEGHLVAINSDRMTSEQLRLKSVQLARMAKGLTGHVDELERYAKETGRGW